jgi:uncharacterized membrane protein YgdD (TMEM256/DUF423 family)
MSHAALSRILVVLATLMGAAGVALAAASAHQGDAARLAAASSMLLFHASAVLAAVLLAGRIVHRTLGLTAGSGFVAAAALFAGDLTMRQYAGQALFPLAAPAGGTLLIVSWLILGLAALWPIGKH